MLQGKIFLKYTQYKHATSTLQPNTTLSDLEGYWQWCYSPLIHGPLHFFYRSTEMGHFLQQLVTHISKYFFTFSIFKTATFVKLLRCLHIICSMQFTGYKAT